MLRRIIFGGVGGEGLFGFEFGFFVTTLVPPGI
jgi:hypothetical protein